MKQNHLVLRGECANLAYRPGSEQSPFQRAPAVNIRERLHRNAASPQLPRERALPRTDEQGSEIPLLQEPAESEFGRGRVEVGDAGEEENGLIAG